MSYVPTPPPEPRPQPPRKSRTGPILLGAVISVAVSILGPVAGITLGDTFGLFGLTLLAPLACLVVGIVLLFPDSTRPWGIGLLIGFFGMLIIGAGACVLLLMSLDSAYGLAP